MSDNDEASGAESQRLAHVVARTLQGDVAEIRRVIEALPPTHPRRRLLLSNVREVMSLLRDMPGILTIPS